MKKPMEVSYLEREIIEMLIRVIDEHNEEVRRGGEVLIKEVIRQIVRRVFEALGNQKKQGR